MNTITLLQETRTFRNPACSCGSDTAIYRLKKNKQTKKYIYTQCQLLVDGQANHIVHLNFDTHVNPLLTPGLSVLISPRDKIQMFRREECAFTTCTSH